MSTQIAACQSTQLFESSEGEPFRMGFETGEQTETRALVDHPVKSVVCEAMPAWLQATTGHRLPHSAAPRQRVAVRPQTAHTFPKVKMPNRHCLGQGRLSPPCGTTRPLP